MRWSELGVRFGPPPAGDLDLGAVVYDSRRAGPGRAFVAVPGSHRDGHHFVAAALAQGAPVAVVERVPEGVDPGRLLLVPDSRAALAQLAAALERHPSRALPVLGVTGTDGKTTTTTLLHAALTETMGPAGAMTTVDFRIGAEVEPNLSRQTTLEAPEVQALLRRMVEGGCRVVALEATSHALALHRLDEVDFRGAVYTNVTHDHLDFHGSWENYLEAKAGLLDRTGGGFAVLNRDDERAFARLRGRGSGPRLTYSAAGRADADLVAESVLPQDRGLSFRARTPAGTVPVHLGLAGRWNVGNALAALAAGLLLEQPLEGLARGLARLPEVPGRMQRVDLGQPFSVIVDYAHTPAALSLALQELRPATPGRLWVVFGSAGERDLAKRPEMGRIAAQLADQLVLTNEDPRDEDPEVILDQIWRGAIEGGALPEGNLRREPDRRGAIRLAVEAARPGDTVLLAGKGHEHSIIGPQGALPWDERLEAENALRGREGAWTRER